MNSYEPHGGPAFVPLNLRLSVYPSDFSIGRADNSVLYGIPSAVAIASNGFDEGVFGPVAVVWMDSSHPIFMCFVQCRRRQTVYCEVFRGSPVVKPGR